MCRADEMACGGLERFFDLISQTLITQLNARHAVGLIAEDRGKLVDFFAIGKRFIYIELVLRVSRGWSSLPLRALGIGNADHDVVVECLLDCLAQFEALSVEAMSPFEWNLFSRDGPLRGQVLAIVQGAHTRDQVPELRRYRFIAQFLPIMEAPPHPRDMQTQSQTTYTYVSGQTREWFQPLKCLESLGLQARPEIQPHLTQDGKVHSSCPHDCAVVA